MRSTARLRDIVDHAWANVAMRPWVVGDPYNTSAEVDAALKNWARTGPSYREHYEKIRRQYPVAEAALADYCRRRFGRSPEEAKQSATYMLDLARRYHYAFSIDVPNKYYRDTGTPNPWRR